MFSPDARLGAAPRLRIRPVPEWDACLVYDPGRRRLVELNLAAWLALELCDGRSFRALRGAFEAATAGRIAASEVGIGDGPGEASAAGAAVARLVAEGLVRVGGVPEEER